jgi:hypothetical protein
LIGHFIQISSIDAGTLGCPDVLIECDAPQRFR